VADVHRRKGLGSNINKDLFKYVIILNIDIRTVGSVETVDIEINNAACFKVRGVLSWG
jgi:hypothetical protein